ASGARSFHLFHWRAAKSDLRGYLEAQSILAQRYPAQFPQAVFVWLAALRRDQSIQPEFGFENWHNVYRAWQRDAGRELLLRAYRRMRRAHRHVTLMDYVA